MKKIIFLLIILSFLIAGCKALAEANLPDPGILPDSNFYFLKTWQESIQTFFTFGAENKAKQYLHLAELRLAEYQKMIEKGKTDIAQKTLDKYEKQLNNALAKVEELKNKGKDVKDISEKVQNVISKHAAVLQRNLEKAPAAAKQGLENAIENSQKVLPKKNSAKEEPKTISGNKDDFVKCLADKGVKMYGASWCPHCQNQKALFGESVKYLPYIECAIVGSQTQAAACQDAGIRAYPTWIFPDGKKNEGEMTFEQLSQYSGCKLWY